MVDRGKKVTREELYSLVWETPVDALAKEFGVSGRGLKKICERMGVPTPPRGYWARLNAGAPVVQYRLEDAKEETEKEVWISPTPERGKPIPPEPIPESVQAVIDENISTCNRVQVSKTLRNSHWLVRRWLEDDQRTQQEYRRNSWGIKHEAIDGSLVGKRRLLVLSTLLNEWERLGYKVEGEGYGSRQIILRFRDERIELQCFEYMRQLRRPLTDEEKKESWNQDRRWRQTKESTGQLIARAKVHVGHGVKTEWRDDGEQRVEERLDEVVGDLVKIGALLEERSRIRAEESRQRAIEERIRYEADRKRKRDAAQFSYVRNLANLAQEAVLVRTFLDKFEKQCLKESEIDEVPPEAREWLQWARNQADSLDPFKQSTSDLIKNMRRISEWDFREWR